MISYKVTQTCVKHSNFFRDRWGGTWTYFTSSEAGKVCVHLMLRPNCTHQIVILGMHFLGDKMNLKEKVINWYERNTLFVSFSSMKDFWYMVLAYSGRGSNIIYRYTVFLCTSLYYFVLKLNSLALTISFFCCFCRTFGRCLRVCWLCWEYVSSYVFRNSLNDVL